MKAFSSSSGVVSGSSEKAQFFIAAATIVNPARLSADVTALESVERLALLGLELFDAHDATSSVRAHPTRRGVVARRCRRHYPIPQGVSKGMEVTQ